MKGFRVPADGDWTGVRQALSWLQNVVLRVGNAALRDVGTTSSDVAAGNRGVTNGDSHDHSGGDGAQIDHGALTGLADDDHTQYHTDARGDLRYDVLGSAAAAKTEAIDASEIYTDAQIDIAIQVAADDATDKADAAQTAAEATAAGELAAHVADSDPHAGYQQESEKGAANGYASLDAGGTVPSEQLPSLSADRWRTWMGA